MPSDRKRLLGYVETIQLILGVTDKYCYIVVLYAFGILILTMLQGCGGSSPQYL